MAGGWEPEQQVSKWEADEKVEVVTSRSQRKDRQGGVLVYGDNEGMKCLLQCKSIVVKLMNLEPGSVLGIMMLWPLRKLGCERDMTGSSTRLGFDVSDELQWGMGE